MSRLSSESPEGRTRMLPPRRPLWRGESEVGRACRRARPGPPHSLSGWVSGEGAWYRRLRRWRACPQVWQPLRCLIRGASQSVASSNGCSCVAGVGSTPHISGTSSNPEESSADTCKLSHLRKTCLGNQKMNQNHCHCFRTGILLFDLMSQCHAPGS